ncbi:MAG TPA: hypothetical protein VMF50_04795 [Candidatus Binataceae bacterium]|nr:hypothetical protein [Candidatus Binataceae bacterium]
MALALALAGVFIPLVGVLFLTPIAIVLGMIALYGGYKIVGIPTLIVIIVNFLISPSFWLNLLAGASESDASTNLWLACFDIAGVATMLYLSVRQPRQAERRTLLRPHGSFGLVASLSSVFVAVMVVAFLAYLFPKSLESGPAAPISAKPVIFSASSPSISGAGSSLPLSASVGASGVSSATGEIYVLARSIKGIAVYDIDSVGTVTVITRISGPLTGLGSPSGMALDANGRVYISNSDYSQPSIVEYAPGAVGNVLPTAIIAGPATELHNPQAIRISPRGNIYVANGFGNQQKCILEFAPAANGNASPIAVFGGVECGFLGPSDISLDGSSVYDSNRSNSSIIEYSLGDDHLFAVTTTISGPATGLDSPDSIALDASGNPYVVNSNSVTAYRSGSDGAVTPFLTIFGPATGLEQPHRIAVDGSGYIYVANKSGLRVLKFAPGSDGDVAPVAVIDLPKPDLTEEAWNPASIKAVTLGQPIR